MGGDSQKHGLCAIIDEDGLTEAHIVCVRNNGVTTPFVFMGVTGFCSDDAGALKTFSKFGESALSADETTRAQMCSAPLALVLQLLGWRGKAPMGRDLELRTAPASALQPLASARAELGEGGMHANPEALKQLLFWVKSLKLRYHELMRNLPENQRLPLGLHACPKLGIANPLMTTLSTTSTASHGGQPVTTYHMCPGGLAGVPSAVGGEEPTGAATLIDVATEVAEGDESAAVSLVESLIAASETDAVSKRYKSVAEKLSKANKKPNDQNHLESLAKKLTSLNNPKTVANTQEAKVKELLNMFRERTSQMVAEAEAASKQALAAGVNVTRNFDNLVALMRDRLQPGGALDTLETSALEEFATAKASATARLKTAAARSKAAVGAAPNKKRSPPYPDNYPDKKQATVQDLAPWHELQTMQTKLAAVEAEKAAMILAEAERKERNDETRAERKEHALVARHEMFTKLAVMEAEKAAMSQAEAERKKHNDETMAERKEQALQLMAANVEAAGARASQEAFKDGQTSLAALLAQQQPPPPYQPLHHQQQLVYQQPQTMYQPHQPQLLQQQTQMPLTPQPLLLNEPMQGPPLQPLQTHPPAQLPENNQQQQPSQQPSQQMYPPLPTPTVQSTQQQLQLYQPQPTQQSTQQQLQLYQPQPYQPQQHQHQQYQPQQPPPLFYPPHQQPQQQPYQQHPQNQQPQYLQTQQPQQQQQQHQHQQYQPYQQPPPLFYPPHQQPQQQHPQNQQPQALQQQQPHQQPQPHQPPP